MLLANRRKMDQFIGRHNQPKFTQDEIDNLNRLIVSKEIASIINNLPKLKALGPEGKNSTEHLQKI